MTTRKVRIGAALILVLVLIAGAVVALRPDHAGGRTTVVAYFDNSNGIFQGDEVRILGVRVGNIHSIVPEPQRVKVTFWFDDHYAVPADVKAVIVAPSLVTSRAIQLTPTYSGGPALQDNAVIPQSRTAVPMEWDDFRKQVEKLTKELQPTEPGGVSALGAFVTTAADNLRGQGGNIRDAVIKLAQAISVLGDHSTDIFATVRNLATLVSGLQSSADAMGQLNGNLAAVSALLADDPNEVGNAVSDLDTAAADVQGFISDNREALGTTSDKLASVSKALVDSLDDIKQTLHIAPNSLQNFMNIYEPAHSSLTGILAVNNFANPISFLCGAVQAASRLGAEQAAKLCVQYLAPIIKNRQYNFPPIGLNPLVGTNARPNEITYSEDSLRPDYVPTQPAPGSTASPAAPTNPPPAAGDVAASDAGPPPLAAESTATIPSAGLQGLMLPPGSGS
jgi:phospholipid/cholesterol/gamma-HCH transport system substrate-binding protein